MASTPTSTRNGIDVEKLVATVGAIQQDPALARFQFRAHSEWQGGGKSLTTIDSLHGAGQEHARPRPFELRGDEPAVLLGGDTAPNAVETVLSALASCITVGYVYNAAARGITIESLTFDLEGDLDLQGFLGLSDTVRPGFGDIRLTYHVKADAPRAQLEELCDYVQRTSPVLDIIRNPVPVTINLAD